MTTEELHSGERWRDAKYYEGHHPQPPAISFASKRLHLETQSLDPATDRPLLTASTYHSGSQHHTPRLTSSRSQDPISTWREFSYDRHSKEELPKYSSAFTGSSDSRSYGTSQSQHTSLPSFASFQEHASRTEAADEGDATPMSSLLSCYLCTKLKPMVREVAIAIGDLDQHVQTFCNRTVTRTVDVPNDSPIRASEWALDRIQCTKSDLQEAIRRVGSDQHLQQTTRAFPTASPRNISPPNNPLKRRFDDMEDASASLDLDRSTHFTRSAHSPPPSESVPSSAYPGRPLPGFPSPSSLAYPPSAAPSLPPPTVQSVGSPTTSYQPTVSIHSASTNSVTSAHIADLQHQVTLKSLSLQTLQSEYASLLQKLQRERVKSQTIEKKTSVADQEINDLTSKTEDLTEQIRNLETQLEESERKRENERAEAAKEKHQWGRMLEMDGRLHAKHVEEKRRLVEENESLARELTAYHDETRIRHEKLREDSTYPLETPGQGARSSRGLNKDSGLPSEVDVNEKGDPNDVASLKQENGILKARNEIFRFSFEEIRRRNQELDEQAHAVIKRSSDIGTALGRALHETELTAKRNIFTAKQSPKDATDIPPLEGQRPVPSPYALPKVNTSFERALSRSPQPLESHNSSARTQSTTSSSTIASIARTVSPGPAELGFHVTPSTLSPEELIKALGPVPEPFSMAGFGFPDGEAKLQRRHSSVSKDPWSASQQHEMKREKRDQPQLGLFRPLHQHGSSPFTSLNRPAAQTETAPLFREGSSEPMPDDPPLSAPSQASRPSPRSASAPITTFDAFYATISNTSQGRHAVGSPQRRPMDAPLGKEPASGMPPPPRPNS